MSYILASLFRITVLEMVSQAENTLVKKEVTNLIFEKMLIENDIKGEKGMEEILNTDNFNLR